MAADKAGRFPRGRSRIPRPSCCRRDRGICAGAAFGWARLRGLPICTSPASLTAPVAGTVSILRQDASFQPTSRLAGNCASARRAKSVKVMSAPPRIHCSIPCRSGAPSARPRRGFDFPSARRRRKTAPRSPLPSPLAAQFRQHRRRRFARPLRPAAVSAGLGTSPAVASRQGQVRSQAQGRAITPGHDCFPSTTWLASGKAKPELLPVRLTPYSFCASNISPCSPLLGPWQLRGRGVSVRPPFENLVKPANLPVRTSVRRASAMRRRKASSNANRLRPSAALQKTRP